MQNKYIVNSIQDLSSVVKDILEVFKDQRVFILEGKMGTGKTTITKAFCDLLGVRDTQVCSPTFAIVNVYFSSKGEEIYHFDFYRLKSEEEAYDIGFEEYLYSGNYCFIEWAEKIPSLMPQQYVKVSIKALSENERKVIVQSEGC